MSYSIRVLIADDQLCPVSLPLAGAAIMLTSMKAVTIANSNGMSRARGTPANCDDNHAKYHSLTGACVGVGSMPVLGRWPFPLIVHREVFAFRKSKINGTRMF